MNPGGSTKAVCALDNSKHQELGRQDTVNCLKAGTLLLLTEMNSWSSDTAVTYKKAHLSQRPDPPHTHKTVLLNSLQNANTHKYKFRESKESSKSVYF